jgi:hypothetical protein
MSKDNPCPITAHDSKASVACLNSAKLTVIADLWHVTAGSIDQVNQALSVLGFLMLTINGYSDHA